MLNSRIMTSRFSTRPLYLQVRDALGERIAGGEWKPSTAIPNEGDLARQFGVSPGTMRKALDLLEAERLLTRRQGRGTFVNDQSSEELAVRYSNIRGKDGAHVAGEVELLDHRGSRRQRGRVHAIALAHARAGLPHPPRASQRRQAVHARGGGHAGRVVPRLVGEDAPSHRIVVLAQQFGILLGRGEERITIGSASPEVAKTLRVEPATPLLNLDRVVCTLDGRPVEWRLGQCRIGDTYYLAEFK